MDDSTTWDAMVPTIKILLLGMIVAITLSGCSDRDQDSRPPTPKTSADSSNGLDAGNERSASPSGQPQDTPATNEIVPPTDATANSTSRQEATSGQEGGGSGGQANRGTQRKVDRGATPPADKQVQASASDRSWETFKTDRDSCNGLSSTDRDRCLARVTEHYRGAHFDCDAVPQSDQRLCAEFVGGRGTTAASQPPSKAVTHDKDPTTLPATPGDSRPAERNRDSTKQNQDAVGAIPETPIRNN